MKRILLILVILFIGAKDAASQHLLFEKITTAKNSKEKFATISPFKKKHSKQDIPSNEEKHSSLLIEKSYLVSLNREKPRFLQLTVPFGESLIVLELEKTQLVNEGFSVKEGSSSKVFDLAGQGAFYHGIISGDPNSFVAVSVFEDEISGVFSDSKEGNICFGKKDRLDPASSEYIIYSEKQAGIAYELNCQTEDNLEKTGAQDRGGTFAGGCINISLEAEYELYSNSNSNVQTVVNGLLSVFNISKALFANEGINVQVSEILVWTVPDPYQTGASTSVTLPQFAATRGSNFNGNLAYLIRWGNIQGLSYLNSLCTSYACFGVVHLNNFNAGTYSSGSGFSPSAYVLSHEIGHSLGSPHTHACAWNGNNTAIDACAATEGGCSTTPVNAAPSNTIMSYCGGNINFANGFGLQPGNLLRSTVTAASCIPAGTCTELPCTAPTDLSISEYPATGSATLNWTGLSEHTGYNIRYRPQNGAWNVSSVSAPPHTITGMNPSKIYEVEIQANCASGSSGYATGVVFSECILAINPTTSISGNNVTFGWSGDETALWEIKYGDKGFDVGTDGTLLSSISGVLTKTVNALNYGNCYQWYIRSVCNQSATGYSPWIGPIAFSIAPLNDNIANALELNVGSEPIMVGNCGATREFGEFNPVPYYGGRWASNRDQTVWFKFTAPESGTVVVSTDFNLPNSSGHNNDPELALYQAPENAANFSNFVLLQSDEDDGTVGTGKNSLLTFSGLVPNQTYYIQSDGWGTNQGTFMIQVLEQIHSYQASTDCMGFVSNQTNGTNVNRWYSIYTSTNSSNQAKLVGAIRSEQNLGNITMNVKQSNASNPIPGIYYAGQYYKINSSLTPNGTTDIHVRLVFRENDLNNLKTLTGNNHLSINQIGILHYEGASEDCEYFNNSSTGYSQLNNVKVYAVHEYEATSNMVYILEFTVKSFSEFVPIVQTTAALPLELLNFQATPDFSKNKIQWVTASESNVKWHIVERSADGVSHWQEIDKKEGQEMSNQKIHYQVFDNNPLVQSYYRLRSVDEDGKESLSLIVSVNQLGHGIQVQAVYPNPAPEFAHIRLLLPNESDLQYTLFDMTGVLIEKGIWAAEKGTNSFSIATGNLSSGCYQLIITNEDGKQNLVRIVK